MDPFFTFLTGIFFFHPCVDFEKVYFFFLFYFLFIYNQTLLAKKKKEKAAAFKSALSRFMTNAAKPATRLHFRSYSDCHKTLQGGAPFQPPEFGTGIWQQPRTAQDVRDTQVASKQTLWQNEMNTCWQTMHIHRCESWHSDPKCTFSWQCYLSLSFKAFHWPAPAGKAGVWLGSGEGHMIPDSVRTAELS